MICSGREAENAIQIFPSKNTGSPDDDCLHVRGRDEDHAEKSLTAKLKKRGGRNNDGRITMRHRGGGHKRHYRVIDFKRDKTGVPARVAAIEYDPNRSARIALLHYADGEKRYILAPEGLKVDAEVISGPESPIRPGNCLPLANIPNGFDRSLRRAEGGSRRRAGSQRRVVHPDRFP